MPLAKVNAKVLLVSCYESGHQPLSIATQVSFLKRLGIKANVIDLAIEPMDDTLFLNRDVIAISVPMHTALRLGLQLASLIKEINPECRLCFFGLYAQLNKDLLIAAGANAVLSGESEEALVSWIQKSRTSLNQTFSPDPIVSKLDYLVPSREELPDLAKYVHLELPNGQHKLVGSVETSRGCKHHCRHCPLPAIYNGRFFIIPQRTVLEDIGKLVNQGAQHINFVDPDFLNGPKHALQIVRAMHQRYPRLTFDFTAKVEHILKRREDLHELAELGCTFIVTAVESLSSKVLLELNKGHTPNDVDEALDLTRTAGIGFKPTFVTYTPWTHYENLEEVFLWIITNRLIEEIEPIQLTLRLLIPPGSLLLNNLSLRPYLHELDRETLTYRWIHPDPEMDRLQLAATALLESSIRANHNNQTIFESLAELIGISVPPYQAKKTPRLTEAWFC